MKHGQVIKLDQGNKAKLIKFHADVMPENCDVIIF